MKKIEPANKSNANRYHSTKCKIRLNAICEILRDLEQSKSQFESLWQLAIFIAKKYNEKEINIATKRCPNKIDKISVSTLVSDKAQYREKVLKHFNSQKNLNEKYSMALLEVTKESQIASLRNQIKKLENKNKNLLKKVEQPHLLTSNFSQNELLEALDASHKVIVALLCEFKDSVAIENENLIDLSKIVDNEIVPKDIFKSSKILESSIIQIIGAGT